MSFSSLSRWPGRDRRLLWLLGPALLCWGVCATAQTISYSYDEAGRLTSVSYPDGSRITYEYDSRSNITRSFQVPASGDRYAALAGNALTVVPEAVIAGAGQGNFTIRIQTQPAGGQVAVSGSSLIYTPGPAFSGIDGFVYEVEDGSGNLTTSAAVIEVYPVNATASFALWAGQRSADLVAAGADGGAASLVGILPGPAPAMLPDSLQLPFGVVSLSAATDAPGATLDLALSLDDASVDGFWKPDPSGRWVNLASAVSHVAGTTTVEFSLTDGGAFDADGVANGIIVDPGGLGEGARPVLTLRDKVLALYIAYYERAPDLDGMEFWLAQAQRGQSLYQISAGFANHPRFAQLYGNLDTRGIVEAMYRNVLRRPGDSEGIDFWVEQVDVRGRSISEIFVDFTVGSLEIDLEALFRGGSLTAADYAVAFERQKILENLVAASEMFLATFGEDTVPTAPIDQLDTDPAYNAAIAVLKNVDADLNAVYDQLDYLETLKSLSDAMQQIVDALG